MNKIVKSDFLKSDLSIRDLIIEIPKKFNRLFTTTKIISSRSIYPILLLNRLTSRIAAILTTTTTTVHRHLSHINYNLIFAARTIIGILSSTDAIHRRATTSRVDHELIGRLLWLLCWIGLLRIHAMLLMRMRRRRNMLLSAVVYVFRQLVVVDLDARLERQHDVRAVVLDVVAVVGAVYGRRVVRGRAVVVCDGHHPVVCARTGS